MKSSFAFGPQGEYLLRPARWDDLALARQWVEADPWHKDSAHPLFWLTWAKGVESYVLERDFAPVFFFRTDKTQLDILDAVQIHIQFGPVRTIVEKRRNIDALQAGLGWLESVLARSKYDCIFFDTLHPELEAFCVARLGFVKQEGGNILAKSVARAEVA
jgi:hypothetical protein